MCKHIIAYCPCCSGSQYHEYSQKYCKCENSLAHIKTKLKCNYCIIRNHTQICNKQGYETASNLNLPSSQMYKILKDFDVDLEGRESVYVFDLYKLYNQFN